MTRPTFRSAPRRFASLGLAACGVQPVNSNDSCQLNQGNMEAPELKSLRRFALVIAIVLITLILAQVELETPVRISPLGIPLIIRRPDLLTIALVLASIYATLRYVYYGMLVQPSPMRARRSLMSGRPLHTPTKGITIEEYPTKVEKELRRYFPKIGGKWVDYATSQDNAGCHLHITNVPVVIRALCCLENIDFLLPVIANIGALCVWGYSHAAGS